jgi:nitroimidazol reductase NimA-like FMN-containing flavoprotein (pyridoxamine 5'-phosphate oxidase superfamily)
MDLAMTKTDRAAFLAKTPRVGVLSIQAAGRAPVSSPVWFTVRADGALMFTVAPESRKAALLAEHGRATMCVQSEVAPYSYVVVEGATENLGPGDHDLRRGMAYRYLGEEMGELYYQSVKDEPNVTFALRPQRWASVDYNKLFA